MTPFSDDQMRRFSRQLLLREVGGRGQRRILAASAALVCRGDVGRIAAEYLTRAGVGSVKVYGCEEPGAPPELSLWVQRVPAASVGRWSDGDLFWVMSDVDGIRFGHGEAGLAAHAGQEGRGAASEEAGAVLAGSALALGMLQGLLGLALPSDCQLSR